MIKYYNKVLMVVALICSTGGVACSLLIPLYIGDIVNLGIMQQNHDVIPAIGTKMLIVSVMAGVFGFAAYVATNFVKLKFSYRLRIRCCHKLTSMSSSQIGRFDNGTIITRMTMDIDRISAYFEALLEMLYKPILMSIGGLVMLFRINNSFGLVFIIFVAVQIALMVFFTVKTLPIFGRVQRIIDRINEKLQETLRNLRLIKLQRSEATEQEQFDEISNDLFFHNVRIFSILSFFNPLLMLMMNAVIVLIVVILGIRAQDDPNIIGNIMMVITYTEQILMSIAAASNLSKMLSEILPSHERIKEILDTETEDDSSGSSAELMPGELEVSDVSFSYVEGKPVLEQIGLRVPKGTYLSVYGGTGSGKSTLASLLGGRMVPTEGSIRLGEQVLADYSYKKIRKRIAIVSNSANAVFSDSLYQNIILGRDGIGKEDAQRAADSAMLGDYIGTLPYGMESRMNAGGNSLSGGQRQRLLISRAIAASPDILIIDDATSALDFATEEQIFRNLRQNYPGMTVILLTQRLQSAEKFGKQFVLSQGRLRECRR